VAAADCGKEPLIKLMKVPAEVWQQYDSKVMPVRSNRRSSSKEARHRTAPVAEVTEFVAMNGEALQQWMHAALKAKKRKLEDTTGAQVSERTGVKARKYLVVSGSQLAVEQALLALEVLLQEGRAAVAEVNCSSPSPDSSAFSDCAAAGKEILNMVKAAGAPPGAQCPDAEPLSKDEFLLCAMEAREDAEIGADAFNPETFGETCGWSFEENLAANEALAKDLDTASSRQPTGPEQEAVPGAAETALEPKEEEDNFESCEEDEEATPAHADPNTSSLLVEPSPATPPVSSRPVVRPPPPPVPAGGNSQLPLCQIQNKRIPAPDSKLGKLTEAGTVPSATAEAAAEKGSAVLVLARKEKVAAEKAAVKKVAADKKAADKAAKAMVERVKASAKVEAMKKVAAEKREKAEVEKLPAQPNPSTPPVSSPPVVRPPPPPVPAWGNVPLPVHRMQNENRNSPLNEDWACPACTLLNPMAQMTCGACDSLRPATKPVPARPPPPPPTVSAAPRSHAPLKKVLETKKVSKPVELADPLPQRNAARQRAPRMLTAGLVLGGSSNSNAASGPRWAERPVERLNMGSASCSWEAEEEDPELACYLWNRQLDRPRVGGHQRVGIVGPKWGTAI
jgi:hypothetical protein